MPLWPRSPGLRVSTLSSLEKGDTANVSDIAVEAHTGTHLDAPSHFARQGLSIDRLEPERFVGPTYVADIPGTPEIGEESLEAAHVPVGTTRLLLRTQNSVLAQYRLPSFQPDYAALTRDGANWVVDRGIQLVGIDYLSIQRFDAPPDAHQILLGANVCILEGTVLRDVAPGSYDLVCLPLALVGLEASPVRAVLIQR
jgi:arylformamidase